MSTKKVNRKFEFDTKAIGLRLRAVRKELNLGILQVEEMTGLSRSTISEVENGVKKPSSVYLAGYHAVYKVNLNYIFTGEGEMFMTGKDAASGKIKEKTGDKAFDEMMYMIENVGMIRYYMVAEYLRYKTEHSSTLQKIIEVS